MIDVPQSANVQPVDHDIMLAMLDSIVRCDHAFCLRRRYACRAHAARADWPEFRGPYGNGHVAAAGDDRARRPAAHLERNRKRPLEDADSASRLVHARRHGRPDLAHHRHRRRPRFFAICVDADTGKILHNKKLFHCDEPEPLGNNVNCYAAPSPAIEPGRVYVHFGSYGTACLDTATGEVLWQRDDLPCRHYRGPSSSVVLFENLVILTLDGVDLQYVVALDKKTGNTVWKTDRDVEWNDQDVTGKDAEARQAASATATSQSPQHAAHRQRRRRPAADAQRRREGRVRLRPAHRQRAVAHRRTTTSPSPRGPSTTTASPTCVTGITHPELWAVRTDAHRRRHRIRRRPVATQDRRLAKPPRRFWSTASSTWSATMASSTASTPPTATRVWQKRIGGTFAASPIYADGRIYFCDQDGETTVIKPGRKFEAARHQHARRRLHGLARRRWTSAHPPHQDASLPHRKCGAGCQLRPSLSGRRLAVARRGQVARNSPWRGEGALNQRRVLTSQTIRRPSRSIRELPASQPANRPVGAFRACSLHNRDRSNTSWVLAATR